MLFEKLNYFNLSVMRQHLPWTDVEQMLETLDIVELQVLTLSLSVIKHQFAFPIDFVCNLIRYEYSFILLE